MTSLQPSGAVEGSGPAGTGVAQSASRGGRVSHSTQVQERSSPEAQDSPSGTVAAPASGRALPY